MFACSHPSSMLTPCMMMELAILTFSLTVVEFPTVDLLIDVLSAIWQNAPMMLSDPIWTHTRIHPLKNDGPCPFTEHVMTEMDVNGALTDVSPDISLKWQQTDGLLAPQTALGPGSERKDNEQPFKKVRTISTENRIETLIHFPIHETHHYRFLFKNFQSNNNGDSYTTSPSPVCLLPCRLLACWRGSRGPHPWCGHSSGAFPRGKPRTCRHDGHSNRSAPEPAGGETRLVMKWGVLDRTKNSGKKKNKVHTDGSGFG